ncbi:DUF2971 domain-containing protein [Sphingopyxis sp. BSNA05]|nr:DUF2971 domain-containing protein [Sphingopyxis sp. BSNA05]
MRALKESYLYAPPFSAMNDPMEAFYETGGPADHILDALLTTTGKSTVEMYRMLSEMIEQFALVSFAGTYEDLPMWAYYGSNFAGMCLAFESSQLEIGDFQNEHLRSVTYARKALPALTIAEVANKEAVIARITRKRSEWAHEKEWRFITGEVGPKHYLDDALQRVYLGPRVNPKHAKRICEVLQRRPVEILQGKVQGFDLIFESIQKPCNVEQCERTGAGNFNPVDHEYGRPELEAFLKVPYQELLEECQRLSRHPNLEQIAEFDIASSPKNALYLWVTYKLRSGKEIYHKRYYDQRLKLMPSPA